MPIAKYLLSSKHFLYKHIVDVSGTIILSIFKDKDELSFQKGEQLKILYKEATDWWKARNKKGQVGLIPQNYVTKVVLFVFPVI